MRISAANGKIFLGSVFLIENLCMGLHLLVFTVVYYDKQILESKNPKDFVTP